MFWVALATAIMMLSGEGDDTRAIAALLAGLRQAIAEYVPASPRREEALRALTGFEQAFATHRRDLQVFGKCVEAVDHRYAATQADYAACAEPLAVKRALLRQTLADVQRKYDEALLPAERDSVSRSALALPEAWVLDPTLAAGAGGAPPPQARFRGLEGVAARRHLTLPRNVVSIVFGPLGPATFGQRYPSQIVDGGTSYLRQRWTGTASPTPLDQWHTRLGVRFGLFDDFEAGALFLPFELSPTFEFESVTVFLTQQFRLRDLDLALRFSFQTPGNGGWAIAPGALLGSRSRTLAIQTGVLVPMELGSRKEPKSPTIGVNVPVRATWNLAPTFFVNAETGGFWDDPGEESRLTIPLGFGAGYTWLTGSRIIELTTSFTWDDWLLPSPPAGVSSSLQLGIFRVAAGASLYFQAL